VDPEESQIATRDAHRSATLLAFLMFLWGALSLELVRDDPFLRLHTILAGVSALALAVLLWRWKRPNAQLASALSAVLIAYALILLPWIAMGWCRQGRPVEAFTVPEVAMVSIALIIPRPLWIGAVTMGLFALEGVFVIEYARHLGLADRVPINEPFASMVCAALGIGFLVLRRRRRVLTRQHIVIQGEVAALRRMAPLFVGVRDELSAQLAVLANATEGRTDAPSQSLHRAVGRLTDVGASLEGLVKDEAPAVPAQAQESAAAASDTEKALLDRDAWNGATVLVTVTLVGISLILSISHQGLDQRGLRLNLVVLLFAVALLGYLVVSRLRFGGRGGIWAVVALTLVFLPVASYNQAVLAHSDRPYVALLGHKLVMVALAMIAASRFRIGLALIVATAVNAMALFYVLHLGAHKELIPFAEPWEVLVFLLIAVIALRMREQRLIASVRLLRAEAEVSSLQRRAAMFLALCDRLNSPLQTLVIGASAAESQPVNDAVARLVELSRRIGELSAMVPQGSQRASFDAEAELRRRV
jgi:hypothetical protein